jgi:hypothetical protein
MSSSAQLTALAGATMVWEYLRLLDVAKSLKRSPVQKYRKKPDVGSPIRGVDRLALLTVIALIFI